MDCVVSYCELFCGNILPDNWCFNFVNGAKWNEMDRMGRGRTENIENVIHQETGKSEMAAIDFVKKYKVFSSISLFLVVFAFFHFVLQPSITYFPDGSFRPFGIQYTDETFLPVWLVSILLGILAYTTVLYVSSVPSAIRGVRGRGRKRGSGRSKR
jgi:hypothetical protein